MADYVLSFDSYILELEKMNKWKSLAYVVYQNWKDEPYRLEHVLCAGTELWYIRLIIDYFEDWSPHPYGIELANREEIEDMLMDVTRCGLKHFHNNSTFNAYFGYMFKVMPYFFKDYNGDYVGWQQKGISMMRYSYMLDSLNPLAKAMYYEIDCDNESDYIQACQELWKQIDPIEWGQSEVQMYFYSVLNGNAS